MHRGVVVDQEAGVQSSRRSAADSVGRLRVSDACVLIGLQRRQVFRLQRGLKQDGPTSLLSKHRGRRSNHGLPAEVRTLALSIVREHYADFGPTPAFGGRALAAERLARASRLLGLASTKYR